MNRTHLRLALIPAVLLEGALLAEIEVDPHLASHMVIQADEPFVMSGQADPGEALSVVVTESGSDVLMKADGTADASGRFLIRLDGLPAGNTAKTVTIRGADDQVVLDDVLFGEVWLCSGQSNMVWRVRSCDGYEEFRADANRPTIRTFNAWNVATDDPRDALPGNWLVCSPDTVGDFSGVGYHFGRQLSEQLDVPIGLYNVSWGGSRAEAWISPDRLSETAPGRKVIADWNALKEQMNADPGPMAGLDADDSDWIAGQVPGRLDTFGIEDGVDGIFWQRIPVRIPNEWAGRDLRLSLGAIDDHDTTFFNGVEIGSTRGWETPRRYTIPGRLVEPGRAMIAVRIIDGAGPGGLHGEEADFFMHPMDDEGDRRLVNGSARVMIAGDVSELPDQHRPSQLYHGMLHPLRDVAFAGVTWYQGENNAMGPGSAEAYAELLPVLINDWRDQLPSGAGEEPLPFLIVQLANLDYRVPDWDFPLVRDIQRRMLELPGTGFAVTTDIGDARDIHPRNKHDVGDRLARWALVDVYGRDGIVKSGPLVSGASLDRGGVVVEFAHFGSPLAIADGKGVLGGFEVARGDGDFQPATAMISSDRTVRVRIPAGKGMPNRIRYAWKPDPADANLVNEAGLPAAAFELPVSPPPRNR